MRVAETYPEHSQTSKMKLFAKIVNVSKLLIIFAKKVLLNTTLGCADMYLIMIE